MSLIPEVEYRIKLNAGRVKMSIKKETYKGCDIEIEDDKKLMINKKEIDYQHYPEQDKWVTRYLPYSEYSSLGELAKAIATNSSEFKKIK